MIFLCTVEVKRYCIRITINIDFFSSVYEYIKLRRLLWKCLLIYFISPQYQSRPSRQYFSLVTFAKPHSLINVWNKCEFPNLGRIYTQSNAWKLPENEKRKCMWAQVFSNCLLQGRNLCVLQGIYIGPAQLVFNTRKIYRYLRWK